MKTAGKLKCAATCGLLSALASVLGIATASADAVSDAKDFVAKLSAPNAPWSGPTTGPKALPGKSIIYVSTDQRNGGARGAGEGVKAAAARIGWTYKESDGQGSVAGRATALNQAIASKPDVIVLGGIDATEQAAVIEEAAKQGIVVIGWHAYGKSGPHDKLPIFTNITTDPLEVARAAASYPCAELNGKVGAVIFTDSTYEIAVRKSNAMAEVIKACGDSKVLEIVDTPLADASNRMPQLTTSLLQRHGKQWTTSLSINDLTFDFMAPSLSAAGLGGSDNPVAISAGDGSEVAFQRIRAGEYQAATVAEPLILQGWQIVDEANRALNKEKESGFVAPAHLFLKSNIESDGGPKNIYDPGNGYADAYAKIWGVK
ncbi:substrate-binding domain-containing protein [Chelatococcus sp. YT9]|uniref:substrate-binding domain-containing protein n=1 Tax=Chelatococcus sp. YT9 TaxID=2835635 RepID=UPI001BD13C62|nr:substrate-binding domain-containing protein [Chelatococcus sp. YT9]MBS7701274.1 substrate-binding domain-containing protein [Chelatococcus sp. YT9]